MRSPSEHHGTMDDYEGRRPLSMLKTQRAVLMVALGIGLWLLSTAFAAGPAQASGSRTASSSTTSEQQQFGWLGWNEVPGNGFTVSGPATTSYNGNDYVFVRGTNNLLYANSF